MRSPRHLTSWCGQGRRGGSSLRPALLLLSLIATAASPAAGEEAPGEEAPGEPERSPEEQARLARAQLHFERGLQLTRSGNWAAALAEFDESIAAIPNRSSLYNRALCLRNLYQYPEAIEAFGAYLEQAGDRVEPAQRQQVEALVAAMEELLTPVTIDVDVDGAEVIVDGQRLGTSPLTEPVRLLSGPHDIELRRRGYVRQTRSFQVVADRELRLAFVLVPQPRRGRVLVSSNLPEATVYVDGEEVGTTEHPLLLDVGRHQLEVRAPGYRPATRALEVEADRDHPVALTLERPFRFHRAYFWSALGLTIAGALTTAGLGTAVAVLGGRYEQTAPDARDQYDRGWRLMRGTDAALGLALIAAAAALVFGLLGDWPQRVEE